LRRGRNLRAGEVRQPLLLRRAWQPNEHQQKPQEGFLLISKTDAEHNMQAFQKEGYEMELYHELGKSQMQVYKFKRP
jgi:hypothetical protein